MANWKILDRLEVISKSFSNQRFYFTTGQTRYNYKNRKSRGKLSSKSSEASSISTRHMKNIMNNLLTKQYRSSTYRTYICVWRQFNKFVISLDIKAKTWEERLILYVTYMVDSGMQSSTVKSYISAIKRILADDGYILDHKLVMVHSLTRACRLINDKVWTRLPISCNLLELILFELHRYFSDKGQPYLNIMYRALFTVCYYGLMRACEITFSEHVVKACNIHAAGNKHKLLIKLYTSKTHSTANRPQEIKIIAKSR